MVAGFSPAYIYLDETYSGVPIWALKPAVWDSMKEIDLRHDTEGKFSMDDFGQLDLRRAVAIVYWHVIHGAIDYPRPWHKLEDRHVSRLVKDCSHLP
jgi:hypothetical protein